MSLIDPSYFIGEINIPNTSDDDVAERLDRFIDKYEERFLNELLGYQLYKDFKAGLAVTPTPEAKWTKLRDGAEYTVNNRTYKWKGFVDELENPIANYVYYWWQRNEVSQTTGIGEVASKGENSVRVSPGYKMTRAWNEMVNQIWSLVSFLDVNVSDYPGWSWYGDTSGTYWMNYNHARLKDMLYPINTMNL